MDEWAPAGFPRRDAAARRAAGGAWPRRRACAALAARHGRRGARAVAALAIAVRARRRQRRAGHERRRRSPRRTLAAEPPSASRRRPRSAPTRAAGAAAARAAPPAPAAASPPASATADRALGAAHAGRAGRRLPVGRRPRSSRSPTATTASCCARRSRPATSPTGDFQLRIPADQLQAALRDLSALGDVRARSDTGQDVTREYVSVTDQLAAARAERRALLRRLATADRRRAASSGCATGSTANAPRARRRCAARSATCASARTTRRSA